MKRLGFAGLMLVAVLFAAQVASAQGGWQECPWGYPAYDSVTHTFVSQCANTKVDAAAKPAGLAQLAPMSGANQGWQGCPWGYPSYDSATRTFVSQCSGTKVHAAAEPAGQVQLAPGEKLILCGVGISPEFC